MHHREIILTSIIGILPEESAYLEGFTENLNERDLRVFLSIYNGKRMRPDMILLLAILGFLGAAGIHRFALRQLGMGILYFFTAGLCFVGTIVDILNHKALCFDYNQKMAMETMHMVKRHG